MQKKVVGAVLIDEYSNVTLKDITSVMFVNNSVTYHGRAMLINRVNFTIEENSSLTFNDNNAKKSGGAISNRNSTIISRGNAIIII